MTTRRWNADTGTWDRYKPAHREYPPLSANLETQLHAIERTHDGMMEYYPCMVVLANGEQHDCVYIAEATSYIHFWRAWPDDDHGKRAIRIEDVAQIQPSPSRLPFKFAREMYVVGESGMGYCIFTLHFADGTHQSYCTGNLIDFPEMPTGKSIRDVLAIRPNQGRREKSLGSRQYHWCLFGGYLKKTFMQRLSSALRFG